MRIHSRTLAATALTLLLVAGVPVGAAQPAEGRDRGAWARIGQLDLARSGHSATLLPDESVLVVGGEDSRGKPVLTAELVYPASGATRPAGTLPWGLSGHDAVLLPDGRVLLSGSAVLGRRGSSPGMDGCAAYPPLVWDPSTLAFTPAAGLADSNGTSATLLQDGRVLFSGGGSACERERGRVGLAATVLWDPRTGRTSAVAWLGTARGFHPAVRLDDGRVLVGGGVTLELGPDVAGQAPVGSLELWDPRTDRWQSLPPDGLVATDLLVGRDGLVVIVGRSEDGSAAELRLLDPTTDTLLPTSEELPSGRLDAALTTLPGGVVAIIGGLSEGRRPLPTAVLWDPASGDRRRIKYPRAGADSGHTATTLSNGTIVVIGGWDANRGGRAIDSVELLVRTG